MEKKDKLGDKFQLQESKELHKQQAKTQKALHLKKPGCQNPKQAPRCLNCKEKHHIAKNPDKKTKKRLKTVSGLNKAETLQETKPNPVCNFQRVNKFLCSHKRQLQFLLLKKLNVDPVQRI